MTDVDFKRIFEAAFAKSKEEQKHGLFVVPGKGLAVGTGRFTDDNRPILKMLECRKGLGAWMRGEKE